MTTTVTQTKRSNLRSGIVDEVSKEINKVDVIANFKNLDTPKERRKYFNDLFKVSDFKKEKRENIDLSLEELKQKFVKLDKATDYVNENKLPMTN